MLHKIRLFKSIVSAIINRYNNEMNMHFNVAYYGF